MEGEKNKECNVCHIKDEKNKLCSRCRLVRYCSAECQKKDWATHKLECKAPQNQLVPFNKDDQQNGEQVKQKGETKNKAILSFNYFHESGCVQDDEKAKQLCLESVKEGNKMAEAMKHLNGWNTQQNVAKAIKMLEEMVSKDKKGENEETSYCWVLLADIYQSYTEKCVEYMNKAVEMGNGYACYFLGKNYVRGYFMRRDIKKGLVFLNKGAELGDSDCILFLFFLHRDGDGVTRDIKKALDYLHRAVQLNNPSAFTVLAGINQFGQLGQKKDEKKALEYLHKAAELDHYEAIYNIGVSYEHGLLGVEVDQQKALSYYRRSAEKDHGESMVNIGCAYRKGKGVEQDDNQAFYWFQKGASKNVPQGLFNLAMLYESGEGVKKDLRKAYELYQKSANLGFCLAIDHLKQFKIEHNFK